MFPDVTSRRSGAYADGSMRRRRSVDRVLFIQSSTSFVADAQVHASLCEHLPALGITVHVAINPGPVGRPSKSFEAFSAIPVAHVRPTRFGVPLVGGGWWAKAKVAVLTIPAFIGAVVGLTRYVRRHEIGVVHCTEKTRETVIGFIVARLSGARLVVHLHVKVEDWFSMPSKWVLGHVDQLIAISEFVAGSAVEMGYRPASISVALNALTSPVEGFRRQPADRDWVVNEFGADPDAAVLCIAARLNPWKGHRYLFEALAKISKSHPNFVLLAIGRDDSGILDELRAATVALGIDQRVRFAGYRDDAARVIRSSDVFVMPSAEEPFGLVYIEAMAAERPVVAFRSGGAQEIVLDGVTGLLAPINDVDALAERLLLLLDDSELGERLGTAGRARVLEHFLPDRLAADVAAIYRSLE